MLIQFSIKNFMSIKDKITFSMLASKDKEHEENLIKGEKENYLRTAVIYGANASGKSNLFKAINIVIMMLRNSNNMQPKMLLPFFPFKFDKETLNGKTEFEIIMKLNDVKYVYGFKSDRNRIYEEYLYYYPNGKQTEIFERTNVTKYHFTKAENELFDIKEKNMENKLFLATATTWNYEKTKPVYDFLTNEINTIFEYEPLRGFSFEQYNSDKNGELRRFSLDLLNKTDLNISGFDVKNVDITREHLLAFPPELRTLMTNGMKGYNVTTRHTFEDEKGNKVDGIIDFEEESLGTKNIFLLIPCLKDTLEKGKIMIIDELDKSLHPLLVNYIVSLFNNPVINKNGAQLIFNTHDTNLLSLTMFRRDQIWFTEKNYKNGSTDLYPLDEFPVRKNENIQKGYLNGRYGAIPFIAIGEELWQDQ